MCVCVCVCVCVCIIVYLRGSTVYCGPISCRAKLEQCHVKICHTIKKQEPNLSKLQYRFLQRRDQMMVFFSLIFGVTKHYHATSLIFSSAEYF